MGSSSDQGANPGPLHWECRVLATRHQGSPPSPQNCSPVPLPPNLALTRPLASSWPPILPTTLIQNATCAPLTLHNLPWLLLRSRRSRLLPLHTQSCPEFTPCTPSPILLTFLKRTTFPPLLEFSHHVSDHLTCCILLT